MYPNLLLRFQNISEDGAKKIVEGDSGGSDIRDRAFKIMLDKITPAHLRQGDGKREDARAARQVLPMITQRAAEGLVQASEHSLLNGPVWVESRLPILWPHILSIAGVEA
jgi:hypothetical protein